MIRKTNKRTGSKRESKNNIYKYIYTEINNKKRSNIIYHEQEVDWKRNAGLNGKRRKRKWARNAIDWNEQDIKTTNKTRQENEPERGETKEQKSTPHLH